MHYSIYTATTVYSIDAASPIYIKILPYIWCIFVVNSSSMPICFTCSACLNLAALSYRMLVYYKFLKKRESCLRIQFTVNCKFWLKAELTPCLLAIISLSIYSNVYYITAAWVYFSSIATFIVNRIPRHPFEALQAFSFSALLDYARLLLIVPKLMLLSWLLLSTPTLSQTMTDICTIFFP